MKCPICEIDLKAENPEYCGQCGWEFKRYLSEVSEKEREAYKRRVEIARGNWRRLQELEQGKARPAKEIPPETGTTSPKARALVAASSGKTRYSEDTPPPDFERDPFETVEEFEARINNHPPVLAGTATLEKAGYDIDTGRFPVKVEWKAWVSKVSGLKLPKDGANAAIQVKRETARALWENGPAYPVFLTFSAQAGKVKVKTWELVAKGTGFSIQGLSGGKGPEQPAGETWVEPVTGMEFVWVPGGTFKMGDLFMEGNENELPVHEVRLSGFWMGKYPVTRGQFKEFVIDGGTPNGMDVDSCKGMGKPLHMQQEDTHPVVCVSRREAVAFAEWLKIKTGHNIQLPSEQQWEYVARSGGKKERYSGGDIIDDLAWYSRNSNNGTHPVGTKRPNGLGLYDMTGNVLEWCANSYGTYSVTTGKKPTPAKGGTNRAYWKQIKDLQQEIEALKGPGITTDQIGRREDQGIARGGSWRIYEEKCRCAYRNQESPAARKITIGFRLTRFP